MVTSSGAKFTTMHLSHHEITSAMALSAATAPTTATTTTTTDSPTIDINVLRERSKHMDLPLISALCNDRSLLKQTKAFVMPKHPRSALNQSASIQAVKGKYPVSGLSTTQLAKPRAKTSISHRHPNDKLPPLPVQTIEGNNYVMDPTPTAIKHKSFSSQPNLKQTWKWNGNKQKILIEWSLLLYTRIKFMGISNSLIKFLF